jgi:NAD(P)-dependent dehydrogenase (short-subunit alcohol dehydrogenase family)
VTARDLEVTPGAGDGAVAAGSPATTPSAAHPDLVGRVVLVTGGGSGLGRATSILLAASGMRVIAADVAVEGAAGTVAAIEGDGGEASAVELDVTRPDEAAHAVAAAVDRYGALDVLVNNAGTDVTAPFESIDGDDWDRVLEVNLHGPARMTRAALPALRASDRAHVVNIASTAAIRGWAEASAYHASKWGLRGLGLALFADLRRHGIRVTTIYAGGMRTPFILDRFPDVPLDVLQDPANVAAAIRFALTCPPESVVAELLVVPAKETSWP